MGQWKYRKPEPRNIRGICCVCAEKPQKETKKDSGLYHPYCNSCKKKLYGRGGPRKRGWKPKFFQRQKKDMCGTCGFKPTHPCQLDVDHIDGNHSNDSLDNLQTLCANCHRLKTYIQRHNPELV